jgi:hypothetical protein
MRWWVAVTAGRVLAAVEEYAAVRPMAWVLRPPVSVVVTVVLFVLLVHDRAVRRRRADRLAERAVPGAQSLWLLVVVLAAFRVGSQPARTVSSVISLGAKIRNGGPQKPVPRLV